LRITIKTQVVGGMRPCVAGEELGEVAEPFSLRACGLPRDWAFFPSAFA